MNIIPWRRNNALLSFPDEVESFFQRLWEQEGNGGFERHLPELFRMRDLPPVNVAETEDHFSITMDCPGLEEDDFSVEAMGNVLVVSGERKWEREKKGKEYRRVESQYGRFERSIPLPTNVKIEAGEVQATYEKGVLTIEVPKRERTPAAKIPVRAGGKEPKRK